jgi:hypothetical protein
VCNPLRPSILACALAARADRSCFVVLICGVYRRGRLYAQESRPEPAVQTLKR